MMNPTNGTHPTIRDVEARLATVDASASVSSLACVGAPGEWRAPQASRFPAHIGPNVIVREFARVHAGCERPTLIGERTLLMSGSHVGHDAHVGTDVEIAPNAVIGGLCTIGDRVKIGMGAQILPHVTIGDGARIGAGAVVMRDVPANETWVGVPAKKVSKWLGVAGEKAVQAIDEYHHGEAS
jgi:acetyltransferase-like isoleucine patch superfamily enzyme